MQFKANNELALHVSDPAKSKDFYERVLGCSIISESADCIELSNGVLKLYLLRDPDCKHDRAVLSFDVVDRNEAIKILQSEGCVLVPIGPHSPGGFYIQDPNGVLFDVIERIQP